VHAISVSFAIWCPVRVLQPFVFYGMIANVWFRVEKAVEGEFRT